MTNTAAIEARDIWRRYGTYTALSGVSISAEQGEFLSLVGPSGSGKTTLLRILGGFDIPDGGRVYLNGADITDLPPERRRSNMVFQRGALFPHMSVAENIAYPLRQMQWARKDIDRRVDELLEVVRLPGFAKRKPSELSGGQAQRIALARALSPSPPVLLLDEPFSALDLALRKELQLELRRIHADFNCTCIFVTHDQEEALVLSDRIAIMDRGEIVQLGTPAEIYLEPRNLFVSCFIGEMNLIEAKRIAVTGNISNVQIGGYRLDVETDPETTPGDMATLLVRPENIGVQRLQTPGSLKAVVEQTAYLGSRWRFRLHVKTLGTTLWAEVPFHDAPEDLSPGTTVFVTLRPERCRLMSLQSAQKDADLGK